MRRHDNDVVVDDDADVDDPLSLAVTLVADVEGSGSFEACQRLKTFLLICLNVERLDLRMLLRLLSSITYRMVEKTKAIIMQEDISDVANGTYLVEVLGGYWG